MKNKKALFTIGFSALMITSLVINTKAGTLEWRYENNKAYWYEDNIKQGTYDDAKGVIGDGTVRGREIYDPESDGWYWLDACYDGAKAVNKEVWIPYVYKDEKKWNEKEIIANANASELMANQVKETIKNGEGKWVRYDANGKMVKGWYTVDDKEAEIYPEQKGNTYYYDAKTGLMAKGKLTIAGDEYTFDTITGVLIEKKEHTHLEPETPAPTEPTTPAHEHSYTSTLIQMGSCMQDNIILFTCNCGHTYTGTLSKELLPHQYSDYVYNNDATTESDGTKTATCTVCGTTDTITAEGTKLSTESWYDTHSQTLETFFWVEYPTEKWTGKVGYYTTDKYYGDTTAAYGWAMSQVGDLWDIVYSGGKSVTMDIDYVGTYSEGRIYYAVFYIAD